MTMPAAPTKAQLSTTQPQAMMQMNVMKPVENKSDHHNHQHTASRLRGKGAGKDCFLGLVGCFFCCECCEGCCDCIGDIVCCPCEMCC